MSGLFDLFDSDPVDMSRSPTIREWDKTVSLPVAGKTPQARHASSTGAQYAAKVRGELVMAYTNLLTIAGPRGMSDHESAAALGRQTCSINSTRNKLGALVVPSGSYEDSPYGTRRARFTLAPQEQP